MTDPGKPKNKKQLAKERRAAAAAAAAAAQRQRRARLMVSVGVGVIVLVFVGLAVGTRVGDDPTRPSTTDAQGMRTTPPPWPALPTGLQARLGDLEFPPAGDESYHVHFLLSVYREGERVTVPANIGFESSGAHSSLHTHSPDGLVHMEADDPFPYELGHVFAVWGVAFGPDRLGSDVATGEKKVHVYVNGKPAPPGPVVLADKDNVVVAYGEEGSFPTLPDPSPLQQT